MKFALTFAASAILFFCFFYFYPAEIFETAIVDLNGTTSYMDLSMRSIFWNENFPSGLILENVKELKPSTSGWLILLICNIGLPLMIAYRTTVKRSSRPKKD